MSKIQVKKGKRGISYRVEIMRNGTRVSKTFKVKKEAQLFAAHALVDDGFADGLTNRTLNTLKFSDAVSEFLTQDKGKDLSKHQRLQHWSNLFKAKTVGKITRPMVRAELKNILNEKSPATANRYKAALGSLFKYLASEFDIDHNPVRGIQQFTESKGRTRFLSNDELQRLFEHAKQSRWERLYLLVLMAVTTGARRSELLTLDWANVDLKKRTAHLSTTKNGSQRVLTLTPDVVSELMKHREQSGWIFPHPQSNTHYFKHFDCYWRELLSIAKIIDFRFHDLRHSCASMLAMNGASLIEIADVLGHKSIQMTQRYSHLCTNHKAELTDRVFGSINQQVAVM